MKIWTIQKREILNKLMSDAKIQRHLSNICPDILEDYQWMIQKMVESGIVIQEKITPFWAWHSYAGLSNPKPDLLDEGHHPKGTKCVCLELNIPDDLVLISQFEMWVWIMNKWYVSENAIERDAVEKSGFTKPQLHQSWNRIFNLDFGSDEFWNPKSSRAIQAVFPYLDANWIQEVESFTAQ